jgi:hypothetical protein
MQTKFNVGDIISFTPHNFYRFTGTITYRRDIYLGYLIDNVPEGIEPSFTEYSIRTENGSQMTVNDAALKLSLNIPATLRKIKENENNRSKA